jgi:hypothetical protein
LHKIKPFVMTHCPEGEILSMLRRIILLVAVVAVTLAIVTCAAPASCAASASGTDGGCVGPTAAATTQTALVATLTAHATMTVPPLDPTTVAPTVTPVISAVSPTVTPAPPPPPPPPTVQITSPADKMYISAGYSPFPVTVSGSATGTGLGQLSWWDTHDFITNVLAGKGPTATLKLATQNVGSSCLPPTTHTISLHVTDAYGRTATAVITVYVGPYCIH